MTLPRFSMAALAVAFSLSCASPTENRSHPITPTTPAFAASVTSVTFGNSVTIGDAGWSSSFGSVLDIESDATVVYAVVFGGSGGKAPVAGVSVAGVPLTRVKRAERTTLGSLDVFRLVGPTTGTGKSLTVTRSNTAYDPVRVTFFTVRGASSVDPNDAITEVDITPGTATATRTVQVASSAGSLTISAVSASPAYLNGVGVVATPGFQTTRATGEDQDGAFGVLGSAPGAASVTHSWNLRADAAGRAAYLVSFNIKAGNVSAPVITSDGSATFGTVTTVSDAGWNSTFGGTIAVESDASVVYAVVFGGSGGKAPVTGVSLGGRPFTRIKTALHAINPASLDVFRLVGPAVGPGQPIAVTHGSTGYDPVRVTVFTVRGANAVTPNDSVLEVDLTPSSAVATRTLTIPSWPGALTISAIAASTDFTNGTGVSATPGFQTTQASGEDLDGYWGVLGSLPGAAPSVTHSYNLRANAAGRYIYAVRFNVFGSTLPSLVDSTPPPPVPLPAPPDSVGGWQTVLDYDYSQIPPLYPALFQQWAAFERPWEQTLYSNLASVNDSTQPGTGSPGAARTTFLPSLHGGYAPVNYSWRGAWPANDGSIDVTFTVKFSDNWDNNGPKNSNDGVKLFFFATHPQNNHVVTVGSRRYDGAEAGGTGTLGGVWVTVVLQAPTVSYKTNMDLTRGAWHTIRMQAIANTPGVHNGRLRVWVDGVQALLNSGANDPPRFTERTDVMFFSAGQVARQDRLEFEPTYGGGMESPPYAQWLDIGHITAAIR